MNARILFIAVLSIAVVSMLGAVLPAQAQPNQLDPTYGTTIPNDRRIEKEFMNSDAYRNRHPDDKVEIKSVNGRVELSGVVADEAAKEMYMEVAQSIRGVKSVNWCTCEFHQNLQRAMTQKRMPAETMSEGEIELRKEELVVGKREVSNGGVLIRTVVQTEKVSVPVQLRREEYVIERIQAGDDRYRSAENAFQPREIYIPLTREEPVTSKRVVLTEKVQIGRRIENDREVITRPVRWEDVEIVKIPAKEHGITSLESGPVVAREPSMDTLNLAKEEFIVDRREVENGGVQLKKVISTRTASQPVDLRREEFTISRTPLNDQPVGNMDFRERSISLGLMREEPVVGVRNYATEIVRVHKRVFTETQMVDGTVRKETVEIVRNPDMSALGRGGTGMTGQRGVITMTESGENAQDHSISGRVRANLGKGSTDSGNWFSRLWDSNALSRDYPEIGVMTHNGVVTLTGKVDSATDKELIGKRVSAIRGVRSVNNELTVTEK